MNRRAAEAATTKTSIACQFARVIFVVTASAVLLAACARPAPAGAPVEQATGHLFRPTNGPVIASPVVTDLDGDGAPEIVIGSWDGYLYVTDAQLRDKPGWPQFSPKGYFSSPAAGDMDGDGAPEIVIGSEAGKVFAWRADGTALPGWPVNLRHRIWASPTLFADGKVAIAGAGQMFVLQPDGRPAKGWPRPILGWADSTAALAEDGAGLLSMATLAEGIPDAGAVHAWRMDGEALPGFPVRLPRDSDSSPALADLDGDGALEIIVGDDAGLLHVLDLDGRELPGFPQANRQPDRGVARDCRSGRRRRAGHRRGELGRADVRLGRTRRSPARLAGARRRPVHFIRRAG